MRRKPPHAALRALAALAFLALVALTATACFSSATAVATVAGRYELRTVDGRSLPDEERLGGVISGDLTLGEDGRVTRVVRYMTSGVPGPFVQRATGTYHVRGSAITLALAAEGRTPPASAWDVRGEVQPRGLVFRYPGPGGRAVEERYERVP